MGFSASLLVVRRAACEEPEWRAPLLRRPSPGGRGMKAVIHQPMYFPYPGFFHKLSMADVFVVMDRAQFTPRVHKSEQNPGHPRTSLADCPDQESAEVLPHPGRGDQQLACRGKTTTGARFSSHTPIRSTSISIGTISRGSTGRLDRPVVPQPGDAERWRWGGWASNVRVIRESELNVSSKSTQRLVDICEQIGADTYVSGKGGRDYMDEALFASRGLEPGICAVREHNLSAEVLQCLRARPLDH